jgi:hypothetical protein
MKTYLWRLWYLKYNETKTVTVASTSIVQIFKDFSSKLKNEYVDQNAVIKIEREDLINWYKKR